MVPVGMVAAAFELESLGEIELLGMVELELLGEIVLVGMVVDVWPEFWVEESVVVAFAS